MEEQKNQKQSMMTPTHYLRVEGVNLSHFVFDTRDLSTTRGAGLLLLNAVDEVITALGDNSLSGTFKTLSRGASMGLFALDCKDTASVLAKVKEALGTGIFAHATFVVDLIKANGNYVQEIESLIAANRWRQMQAASLAVPPANAEVGLPKPACDLDGLRPAMLGQNGSHTLRGEKLSDATWERRKYGSEQKKSFYKEATRLDGHTDLDLPDFAEHFEEICKGSKQLEGKLAVFYADGNNFGSKQAKHCDTPEKQVAFDEYIRGARRKFLREFLEDAVRHEEWKGKRKNGKDDEYMRFETLLWGGDELMFVMPAALGWQFAATFFEKLHGLNLQQTNSGFPDEPLTHAAALVFCQHHSPIHRIKKLAKEQMAEFAKGIEENGNKIGRQRDSMVVVALESFDHLGAGFEGAMKRRYNEVVPLESMILADPNGGDFGAYLKKLANDFKLLRESETFPRSQLRSLVNEMIAKEVKDLAAFTDGKDENGNAIKFPPRHFRNTTKEEKTFLHGTMLDHFHKNPAVLWLQLEELWDYALPRK